MMTIFISSSNAFDAKRLKSVDSKWVHFLFVYLIFPQETKVKGINNITLVAFVFSEDFVHNTISSSEIFRDCKCQQCDGSSLLLQVSSL